jgi:predicted RNA-binding Zn-ribbon protein involved in translation (DUF1610 family)
MQEHRWQGLYLLQATSILMFVTFPFFVGGASRLLGPHWFLPAGILYGALWLNQGRLLIKWPCPRCGRSFLRSDKSTVSMPFRSQCANCGLGLGAASVH